MTKKLFILLVGWVPSLLLSAQALSPPADTVEQAQALAYSGQFREANQLLTEYGRTHTELRSLKLQAKVLYWMQDFQQASFVYEQGLLAFPAAADLQLDYARLLFELGKLEQAEALLRRYLQSGNGDAEALILLASIDYYRGRIPQAKARLRELLSQHPAAADAAALQAEIQRYTAPYLHFRPALSADDQPLRAHSLSLVGGAYLSRRLHPELRVAASQFAWGDSSAASWWLAVGNSLQFKRFGLAVSAAGGFFQGSVPEGNPKATGQAALTQKILPHAKFELLAARQPYQHTTASVQSSYLHHRYRAALELDQPESWTGTAAVELHGFDDGNRVSTAYLWVLAPLLKRRAFLLRAGYSASYADSRRSAFAALLPLDDILAAYQPDEPIAGSYGLYFSPLRQVNHLLLLSLRASPAPKLALTARSSLCLSARADNPYLFLEQGKDGEIYIAQEVSRIRYAPLELEMQARLACSERMQLGASYGFSRLFFFARHQAGLQFIYTFYHETRG